MWKKSKMPKPWGEGYRSPYTEGWPFTRELFFKDGYELYPWHYTGLGRKIADKGSWLIAMFPVGQVVYGLYKKGRLETLQQPELVLGLLLMALLYAGVFRFLCHKLSTIKITYGDVEIGWLSWGKYDRSLVHGFEVEEHPKAKGYSFHRRKEEDKTDPYLDTYRVKMIYGGRKVKVADVYGKDRAEELRDKLQAIHEFMNTVIDQSGPEGPSR